MKLKLRVTRNFVMKNGKSYEGFWCVPTNGGKRLLFASMDWNKAIRYATARAAGLSNRESIGVAVSRRPFQLSLFPNLMKSRPRGYYPLSA